jgi:hypothetical protein
MARQKPNKTSKPPHKQTEEQDKQPNTDPSTNITPQIATARKKITGTIEQSENPQTKPFRTPIQAIFVNNDSIMKHLDKLKREKELKRQEEALYQEDDESLRTVDKFKHGDTNTEDTLTSPKMRDESSPDKSDCKESAHADSDASSPSTKTRQKTSHRQRDDAKMKKMCVDLDNSTKHQLKEQEARHAKEIADMRRVNHDTQNLLTTKTIPSQTITMNNHRITAHFNAMTKASYTLFDGIPENWPIFEHHLLTEAENPTIA